MPAASTDTLGNGLALSYMAQGDQSGQVLVLLTGPTDSDKPTKVYRVQNFDANVVYYFYAIDLEWACLVLEGSPITLKGNADLEEFVASIITGYSVAQNKVSGRCTDEHSFSCSLK